MAKQNEQRLLWKDVVKEALLELGGQAHLSEINKKIEGHEKTKTNPTWKHTIRRVIRQYKIFEPVPPTRSGIYKLIDEAIPETTPQAFTKEPETNHGIAQGMLVTLGKIYGYETYAPSRDQTIRTFQDKPLADFVTVRDCSQIFAGSRNLRKIREVDTIWFDEDDDGLFPKYAFEVEETTGVKSGLDRLLKIPQRYSVGFYIIAPSEKERDLFDKYTNQTPFRKYRESFIFRYFSELEELYNLAVAHKAKLGQFGVK